MPGRLIYFDCCAVGAFELIRRAGLAAIALSAFAAPAAAVPLSSSASVSADDETSVTPPSEAAATLFASATLSQTSAPNTQTSRSLSDGPMSVPTEFYNRDRGSSVPFTTTSSSVIRLSRASPAGGELVTFFVGGEKVAILTEDQVFAAIAGASFARRIGTPQFYVYNEVDPTTTGNWLSAGALGAIGELAGLGLLAIAALVSVCLYASKRLAPRQ